MSEKEFTEMDNLTADEKKKEYKFEDILEQIGGAGRAQALIIVFGILVEVTVTYCMFFFVVEAANPGFVCQQVSYGSESIAYGNGTENQCPGDGFTCSNYTYKQDLTSMVTEWDLVCEYSYYPKLTTSIMFAGVLVGAVLGSLADHFGRKLTVMVAWICLSGFQMSLALANSWMVYVILRFIGGIFMGVCACTANTLPMEYVGPKLRPLVAMRSGWRVGYLTLAPLAWAIRPWRHLTVACGAVTLVFIPLSAWLIPESARWYIQKGQYEKALKVTKWVAKLNRTTAPDISELRRIGEQNRKKTQDQTYTVIDLFTTRVYATRTCTLGLAWFSASLVGYGITSEMSGLTGSIYLNLFLSGFFNLVSRLTTLYTMDKFGRRVCYPLYAGLPTIMCFLIAILDASGVLPEVARTVLAVGSFSALSGAWSAIFALAQEAYPTLLRNTSTSTMNTITRIGGIVAPQISYLGVYGRFIPYLIFGCFGVVSMVFMLIVMPETKGKPLPEDLPTRPWSRKSKAAQTVTA